MNEEEKEVVKLLKHCQNTYIEDTLVTHLQLTTEEAKILLNLIEKQQKEIKRLKEFEKYYENEKVIWQRKDYISKDKIREIKEKYRNDYMTININNRSAGKTFKQAVNYEVRKVIDEMLGENDDDSKYKEKHIRWQKIRRYTD